MAEVERRSAESVAATEPTGAARQPMRRRPAWAAAFAFVVALLLIGAVSLMFRGTNTEPIPPATTAPPPPTTLAPTTVTTQAIPEATLDPAVNEWWAALQQGDSAAAARTFGTMEENDFLLATGWFTERPVCTERQEREDDRSLIDCAFPAATDTHRSLEIGETIRFIFSSEQPPRLRLQPNEAQDALLGHGRLSDPATFEAACGTSIGAGTFDLTEACGAHFRSLGQESAADVFAVRELFAFDVSASSELDATVSAGNLTDGDATSIWRDANLQGADAVLVFRFEYPVAIQQIELQNLADEAAFEASYRIRAFRIETDDLPFTVADSVEDTNQPQRVQVASLRTTVLTIEVTSTFPRSQDPPAARDDLALAEIRFFGTPAP